MKNLTNKEIGEILANETISISMMEMKARKKEYLDKQYWAALHLGFIACMKLSGYSDKDISEVLEVAQQKLEDIERDA